MRITGERGVDPQRVPLCAYGGAGGLHAAALADRLSMPSTVVPMHPGAFSALGLALAGESVEHAEPVLEPWSEQLERALRTRARGLATAAARRLGSGARAQVTFRLRFRGQGASLTLAAGRTPLRAAFLALHAERFGFVPEATPIEVVALAVRAERRGPPLPAAEMPRGKTPQPKRRPPPIGGAALEVFARELLPDGGAVEGPCAIEERTAATWVPGGWQATVSPTGLQLRRSASLTRADPEASF